MPRKRFRKRLAPMTWEDLRVQEALRTAAKARRAAAEFAAEPPPPGLPDDVRTVVDEARRLATAVAATAPGEPSPGHDPGMDSAATEMIRVGRDGEHVTPMKAVEVHTQLPAYRVCTDACVQAFEQGVVRSELLSGLMFSAFLRRVLELTDAEVADQPRLIKLRDQVRRAANALPHPDEAHRVDFLAATADFAIIVKKWMRTKQVYRIDARLLETLFDARPSPLAGDVFAELPFSEFLMDVTTCGLTVRGQGGVPTPVGTVGVLVYRVTMASRGHPEGQVNHVVQLSILSDDFSVAHCRFAFPVGRLTLPADAELGRALIRWRDEGLLTVDESTMRLEDAGVLVGTGDLELFTKLVNVVAYIASQNADVRRAGRVSTPGRRTGGAHRRPAVQADAWDVGYVVGAAIERRLTASRGSGGVSREPGASRRPHVRSAHWHHFWVGHRADPASRKLVVRWVDNVFVNCGEDGPGVVTEHRSRRRRRG